MSKGREMSIFMAVFWLFVAVGGIVGAAIGGTWQATAFGALGGIAALAVFIFWLGREPN